MLRTDPVRLSSSAVSDFKRHVDGKRKTKNYEMLNRQFKFEVSENTKILRLIIDTIILLGRPGLPLKEHRDDSQNHPDLEALAISLNF